MSIITTYTCDLCQKIVDHKEWQSSVLVRLRTVNGCDKDFNNGADVEIGDVCQQCWATRIYPILRTALDELLKMSRKYQ